MWRNRGVLVPRDQVTKQIIELREMGDSQGTHTWRIQAVASKDVWSLSISSGQGKSKSHWGCTLPDFPDLTEPQCARLIGNRLLAWEVVQPVFCQLPLSRPLGEEQTQEGVHPGDHCASPSPEHGYTNKEQQSQLFSSTLFLSMQKHCSSPKDSCEVAKQNDFGMKLS